MEKSILCRWGFLHGLQYEQREARAPILDQQHSSLLMAVLND